jgi:hypothetical protein
MAVKLNLLPTDYTLTGSLGNIVKALRPLNTILLALFLIMTIGMGGFFIFGSIFLKDLNTQNSNLESQIQTQSTAQQQIVLLKDRLAKIKLVQATPEASKNLTKTDPLLTLVSGNSLLTELDVDPLKTTASVVFRSNTDLVNFLKTVGSSEAYKSISLGSFNYNPGVGYQVSLTLLNK